MRIHLGHHFYGAGNLGDDFMLAGFLAAMRVAAPNTAFTCSVPFPLAPLQRRFPAIEWLPYEPAARAHAIERCEVWLGLGGSPFQHAQSRWFVDHLIADAALCAQHAKPMFYLGVGVQSAGEVNDPEVRQLVAHAARIWTRDTASANRLAESGATGGAEPAADLAHILFSNTPPPPARASRVALVANFDFAAWPGQEACLDALRRLRAHEQVWLAQEARDLPGAERALHAALPPDRQAAWPLVAPEIPGAPLESVLERWPSSEWLVTARFHAALAGAWAGSRIVVIGVNEKLRGVARELGVPCIDPAADEPTVSDALASARPVPPATLRAFHDRAFAAVADFARTALASA